MTPCLIVIYNIRYNVLDPIEDNTEGVTLADYIWIDITNFECTNTSTLGKIKCHRIYTLDVFYQDFYSSHKIKFTVEVIYTSGNVSSFLQKACDH